MKIYTRTGDTGQTALFGGGRVSKKHIRVEAYGEVDELNAVLGLAAAGIPDGTARPFVTRLRQIQADLLALGAHLATPGAIEGDAASSHLPALPSARIAEMESWMDEADVHLPQLQNFILPGGTEAAARLHLARTVCRRAERRVIDLADSAAIDPSIIVYLNRLSDLLFTFAREANAAAGVEDVPWRERIESDDTD